MENGNVGNYDDNNFEANFYPGEEFNIECWHGYWKPGDGRVNGGDFKEWIGGKVEWFVNSTINDYKATIKMPAENIKLEGSWYPWY